MVMEDVEGDSDAPLKRKTREIDVYTKRSWSNAFLEQSYCDHSAIE